MTPRELIAAVLGWIVGILVNMMVSKPDPCPRECCVSDARRQRWMRGETP